MWEWAIFICCGLASLTLFLLARRLFILRRCSFEAPCLAPRAGLLWKLQEEVLGAPPQLDVSLGDAREAPMSRSISSKSADAEWSVEARRSNPATLGDGLTPAVGYAWTWAHVDRHLFDAVGHMTH